MAFCFAQISDRVDYEARDVKRLTKRASGMIFCAISTEQSKPTKSIHRSNMTNISALKGYNENLLSLQSEFVTLQKVKKSRGSSDRFCGTNFREASRQKIEGSSNRPLLGMVPFDVCETHKV